MGHNHPRMAPRVGHPVPSAASQPPPRYVSVFKTRACSSQHHFITRCLSCSTMCRSSARQGRLESWRSAAPSDQQQAHRVSSFPDEVRPDLPRCVSSDSA